MDTYRIGQIIYQIKAFLFSKQSREFLIFLLFFFVSAVFWLIQTLNETYEMEVRVPLRLEKVPANIVITEELPCEMRVRLKDKGSVLLNYVYGHSFEPVRVDYSTYPTGGLSGRVRVPEADIQKALLPRLLVSTSIVGMKPDTLEFFYNRGLHKKVPVRLAGYVETLPQCYLADVKCDPDSVVVYAPQAVLDTMQAAYTTPIHIDSLAADARVAVDIRRSKYIKPVPAAVNLQLTVDVYTEKTVEVPIVGINFPGSKDLRTFPSKVSVTFRVGTDRFKSITSDDFVLAISYEELLQNKSSKYRLHLRSLPPGVSQVRISPAEVDYLIEQIEEE